MPLSPTGQTWMIIFTSPFLDFSDEVKPAFTMEKKVGNLTPTWSSPPYEYSWSIIYVFIKICLEKVLVLYNLAYFNRCILYIQYMLHCVAKFVIPSTISPRDQQQHNLWPKQELNLHCCFIHLCQMHLFVTMLSTFTVLDGLWNCLPVCA